MPADQPSCSCDAGLDYGPNNPSCPWHGKEVRSWDSWSAGESRCPFCIDESWEDFVAMCDCWQVDRELEEVADLETEFMAELMSEPPGGHNHGRRDRWFPLETDPQDTPSYKRVAEPRTHGTAYTYRKIGCRCPVCRAWKASVDKGRKR